MKVWESHCLIKASPLPCLNYFCNVWKCTITMHAGFIMVSHSPRSQPDVMHESDDGASRLSTGQPTCQSKTSAPGGHTQWDIFQDGHAAWHSLSTCCHAVHWLIQARPKLFALLLATAPASWPMICQTCLLCLQNGPHGSPSTVSMRLGVLKAFTLIRPAFSKAPNYTWSIRV